MTHVSVPYGDNPGDTATLLLAAVEEIDGLEAGVVVAEPGSGTFTVPEEVAKKAGLDTVDLDADLKAAVEEAKKTPELPSQSVTNEETEVKAQVARSEADSDKPAPAKKTTAKKTTARKTAAKKTTTRKAK